MIINQHKLEEESPLNGELVFYENQIPPLTTGLSQKDAGQPVSGAYRITVEQAISSTAGEVPETIYQDTHDFMVRAPRFSLPPGLLTSVYPPENVEGDYDHVLAQACFSRGTLPWERFSGKDKTQPAPTGTAAQAPWLGILTLYSSDPTVTISQTDLYGLVHSAAVNGGTMPEGTFHPPFDLEFGEQYTDKCLVADIPVALFNRIAPSYDDLKWLAHVREIQPNNKQSALYLQRLKTASSSTSLPKLASVTGNRLPLNGGQTIALLVSFENWAGYLPDKNGLQSPALPQGTETVRLVLLKQWTFFAVSRDQTFSGYLLNLNKKDGAFTGALLQLEPGAEETEAEKAVNNAFKMGYTALNHHTRQGDNTVSWYKGPFLPYSAAGEINIPVNGPDSCTAYNPDTGMFDVSYAAAWQLGRLLALQNGNFAEALYNWKRSNTQEVIANFEEEIIRRTLKEIVDEEKDKQAGPVSNTDVLNMMNRSLTKVLEQFIKNKNDGSTIETR